MTTDFAGFALAPGVEAQALADARFLRGEADDLAPFVLPRTAGVIAGDPEETDPTRDPLLDYWSLYGRLATFSMNAQYVGAPQDTRMLNIVRAANKGNADDPVDGKTHMLWQSLYWVYRYDRWNDGRILPTLILAATRIANEVRRRLMALRDLERKQPYTPNAALMTAWVEPAWEAMWNIPRSVDGAQEVPLRPCDQELGSLAKTINDETLRALITTGGWRERLIAASYIAIGERRAFLPVVCDLVRRRPVGMASIGYCLALARMPSREGIDALLSALEDDRTQSLGFDPWSFDALSAVDALMYWADAYPWFGEVEDRLAGVAPDLSDADNDTRDAWCSHFYGRRRWIERIAEAAG